MIHSAASVILNQVILLTLSLKVLLAALVHWFFLCPCVLFSKPKNSCALSWQKMRKVVKGFETIYVEAVLKPTHEQQQWKPLPASRPRIFSATSVNFDLDVHWWWWWQYIVQYRQIYIYIQQYWSRRSSLVLCVLEARAVNGCIRWCWWPLGCGRHHHRQFDSVSSFVVPNWRFCLLMAIKR